MTIKELSDQRLVDIYLKAQLKRLDKDFIEILYKEIKRRGVIYLISDTIKKADKK
ncbi:hypothetical protein GCM10008967_42350 [Bacillus carboniphilus]|uniref:Sporulation histidine kinase inhibitor Sda n=1 Tax=Bacillus carboniphilus TaxID=86663 RepID=A0ABN0WVA0_9BACI